MKLKSLILVVVWMASFGGIWVACSSSSQSQRALYNGRSNPYPKDTAIFAGGCFWCTEAHFKELRGVDTVISGYIGGKMSFPSYRLVSSGMSGHAESVMVVFDPEQISYLKLLEMFFASHDPTQLNRQGNDIGTQYRSAIFYRTDQQKEQAEEVMQALKEAKIYPKPIVTALEPYQVFYVAEEEHQNFFARNRDETYCRYVITPKLAQFRKLFVEYLKEEDIQQ